ncbi:MAG: AAA family ATPase [Planctomycetes bacterium]|nr:AAA family ATPase [Planctomycetota bacterium]
MTPDTAATLLKAVSTYLPRFVVEAALSGGAGPVEAPLRGAFLRADVSGFTETTERLTARGKEGAQEVLELLNRFYTALLGVAFVQGAEPLGFGGDAVTLVFHSPRGGGDATGALEARRALATGLAMQASMAAFSRVETSAGPVGLSLRVGVEAGPCRVCTLGEGQGQRPLATGGALETAGAAEAAAAPGEVVVGPAALRLLGPDCKPRPLAGGLGVLASVPGGVPPPVPREELALPLIFDDARRTEAALGRLSEFLIEGVYARILESPERLRPTGEFRYASVLFVTAPVEAGGEGPAALRPRGAVVQGLARAHGGALHKVEIEKGVHRWMLVFGAPRTVEVPPLAALHCAEALRRTWRDLRAGMEAGHVFAGNVGHPVRQEYTVIGDAVNVAARVAALAREGEVVVGPVASAALADACPLEAVGPARLKGKRDPVTLHRLAPRAAGGAAAPGTARPAPPLVGREEERADLGRAVAEAAAGRGSALVLVAEAGMGKTRLLEWVLAAAIPPGMAAARVAPEGPESGRAFGRLGSACAALLALEGGPQERRTRLVALLGKGLPAADREAVAAALVPPAEVGPASPKGAVPRNARLAPLLARVLLASCRHAGPRGLVLVLDDLQRSDAASLEVVGRVASVLGGHPILLLGASRSPLPVALGPSPAVRVLDLPPLGPEAARALALAVLGGQGRPVDEEALEADLARSGGNPLFIESLALPPRGAPEAVPGGLQALLLASVEPLGTRARRVLEAIAVAGPEAPAWLVESMDGGEDLDAVVENLGRLGVLRREGALPAARLVLARPILGEVLHDAMALERRRELHRRAAEALEARGGQGRWAALSRHWTEAGEPMAAAAALGQQAEQALTAWSPGEAARLLSGALGLLAGAPAAGELARRLSRRLGDALGAQGCWGEALEAYGRSRDGARAAGDAAGAREVRLREGRLQRNRGLAALGRGDLAESLVALGAALGVARELADPLEELEARRALAHLWEERGELGLAGDLHRECYGLAVRAERFQEAAEAVHAASRVRLRSGDTKGALETLEAVLPAEREAGGRRLAETLFRVGSLRARLGLHGAAREALEEARVLFESLEGDRDRDAVAVLHALGRSSLAAGAYPEAAEAFEAASARAERLGERRVAGHLRVVQARAFLGAGDLARSAAALDAAGACFDALGERFGAACVHGERAAVLARLERLGEARAALAEAAGAMEELGDRLEALHARRGLVGLDLRRARPGEACAEVARVLALEAALGVPASASAALRGLAHLNSGHLASARAAFREAALGGEEATPWARFLAGALALDMSDPAAAVAPLEAALDAYRRSGDGAGVARSLRALALALVRLGEEAAAREALGLALEPGGPDADVESEATRLALAALGVARQ